MLNVVKTVAVLFTTPNTTFNTRKRKMKLFQYLFFAPFFQKYSVWIFNLNLFASVSREIEIYKWLICLSKFFCSKNENSGKNKIDKRKRILFLLSFVVILTVWVHSWVNILLTENVIRRRRKNGMKHQQFFCMPMEKYGWFLFGIFPLYVHTF